MTDQDDLARPEARLEQSDQRHRVGYLAAHSHPGGINIRRIGFSRAAAIPLHDQKFVFQRTLEGIRQIHHRHSGPAMQEKHDRRGRVAATNEYPLPVPNQRRLF
jgi:hypothetical protein